MKTLDHAIISCLAPFILPPYAEKSSEYCDFAFADGSIRTQAASSASDRAIHYTIAPNYFNNYDILEAKLLIYHVFFNNYDIVEAKLNIYHVFHFSHSFLRNCGN